jgi:hypothetical protein
VETPVLASVCLEQSQKSCLKARSNKKVETALYLHICPLRKERTQGAISKMALEGMGKTMLLNQRKFPKCETLKHFSLALQLDRLTHPSNLNSLPSCL